MTCSASSEDSESPPRTPCTIGSEEFAWLRRTVKDVAGIHLSADHAPIAAARLAKRLRATRSPGFHEYIAHVEQDTSCRELWRMVDALTVNQTFFYREADQFPTYLDGMRELLSQNRTVNVWSAGCSTGEEIFTLAMLAQTLLPDTAERVRFLGTDVSSSVLRTARAAVYPEARTRDLPPLLHPMLEELGDGTGRLRVTGRVRSAVRFARHNLVGAWQMNGPMHVIFCRNVLIYFDRPTQRAVVDAFYGILAPGGYLFLGATEQLSADTPLHYLQPAVYRKPPVRP